ncbi:P-loop NTPase [Planctomycetes bacterium TBK1r]|uniref:Tyrosine-protein kinase YwqD n=1 Tax=Stieleria magnilauensis TaxID=2527963 RepID=A0ABX5Y191_9BACT|nr:Tyrosine-protein kinase YwqD [Planctomycetes bacterium TBK1r]
MKTNQTFIGAYTRNRRRAGLHPNDAPTGNESAGNDLAGSDLADAIAAPVAKVVAEASVRQVVEPPHASPPSSHLPPAPVEDHEALEKLLSQSITVSDTFVAASEVWIDQPEGQVMRIDRPQTAHPMPNPIEPAPTVESAEPVVQAEPLVQAEPTVQAEPAACADSIEPTASTAVAPIPDTADVRDGNVITHELDALVEAVEQQAEEEFSYDAKADAHAPPLTNTIADDSTAARWAGATWEVDAFDLPSTVAELFFDEAFFRSIAEHLGQSVREGLRSVLVTSLSSGEGRSTVAIGTAIAAAATGVRVALIDIDLDTPSQSELLRLEVETDWVAAIRQGERIEDAAIASIEDGVTLLPLVLSGHRGVPITPTEIDLLLEQLDGCFDLLLFDGPVAGAWATPQIAAAVDSSLIVRDARRTSPSEVALAAAQLRRQGVKGIGVVDNFCG